MPSRAPYQLQPYSSSYQDSTQVQPRQHFRGSSNVVNARQCSSCAGEGCLSSLECVDHCHPFFLQDVPGERRRLSFFFGKEVSCLGCWPVMMQGVLLFDVSCSVFLSHYETCSVSAQVARLLASCGFGGQYITIAVMSCRHFRSLMALALPCDIGGASNVLTTRFSFQDLLFTRMDTPADIFEKRVCSYLHLTAKSRPC